MNKNKENNQEQHTTFVTIRWDIEDLKGVLEESGIDANVIEKDPKKLEALARSFSKLIIATGWEILSDMATIEFNKEKEKEYA